MLVPGKICWMVGFWKGSFIFWLKFSASVGSVAGSFSNSSYRRVSPELIELVSTNRLACSKTSCLAFLLCRIVGVLMVGNCRIIPLGTVEVGLSCHCLPPLLTACWVHGHVVL